MISFFIYDRYIEVIMKEIIAIYKKQRTFVENSLKAMIDSIDLSQYDEMKDKTIFSLLCVEKLIKTLLA